MIVISCLNFKINFLHKYNPIPVEEAPPLPLLPVKDLSNTRANSLDLIPVHYLELLIKFVDSFVSYEFQ